MSSIYELYEDLKKQKEDYVFSDCTAVIIAKLLPYCPSNQDTLFWFLGGPLLWLFTWRANQKMYAEKNISKVEQKIIALLSKYNYSLKNGYCVLIRKNL